MRLLGVVAAVALAGCGGSSGTKTASETAKKTERAKPTETYRVRFETTQGAFVVEVTRAWAPRGAERFFELVQEKFYDGARFFRVKPKFVVQFRISPDA